ncbi:MAG: acyl-CoA dehydrogenase family protein [Gemmatimonadales bacterium]|nr:acyl-CoA dehydrogenase family protein [Gemmatimonadales bacterium]
MTATAEPRPTARPATGREAEQAARDTAEAARETEWNDSFVKELFEGNLRLDLIHPFPEPKAEDVARAEPFLEALEQFLLTKVDADRIDEDGQVPPDVVEGLRKLGAFGIKVPEAFGGKGLSQLMYTRAIAMTSSICGNLTALLSASQSIGVPVPLKLFGTPEQQKKYFPRLASGQISAFALTENDAGSDPAGLSTSARLSEDGKHWILSGEKLWCTNGTVADVMVVMARTGPKAITAFIVEADWPGVEVVQRLHFMGLRALENGILRFHDVKVPVENVLWGEGKGLKLALITLNTGRLTLPASCVTGAKRMLEIARRWASERVQWGQPIGKHDAIAQKVGRMAAETFALEAVSDLCSLLADRPKTDIRLEAAIAKMWNSEVGWRIVDDTLQIKGGRGYETAASLKSRGERPDPVERALRDWRINLIFEGSSEIMRLFIAREAVDTHLKVAGKLIDPRSSFGDKLGALLKAGLFYAWWYPKQYLGWALPPRYAEFGPLAKHLRFVNRASRRLARNLFHAMIRFGPRLEKKQSVLFRMVEIGADLFAMSAVVSKAQLLAKQDPSNRGPIELADLFCRQTSWRITVRFEEIFGNDDDRAYRLAQDVMKQEYVWLEEGIAGWEGRKKP